MDKENNKALVVYYSETGTTEAIAKKISQATGADLYRIEPEQPYSAADLDWQDDNSRSTKEMNDRTARPAIKRESNPRQHQYGLSRLSHMVGPGTSCCQHFHRNQ